jgi:hypothetical protein
VSSGLFASGQVVGWRRGNCSRWLKQHWPTLWVLQSHGRRPAGLSAPQTIGRLVGPFRDHHSNAPALQELAIARGEYACHALSTRQPYSDSQSENASPLPTEDFRAELWYGDCSIRYMNVLDYLSGPRQPRYTQLAALDPLPSVEVAMRDGRSPRAGWPSCGCWSGRWARSPVDRSDHKKSRMNGGLFLLPAQDLTECE